MPLNSTTFPTEIHDIVVGLLAEEGDMKSVKAFALTHKAILPSCRSYIFATLDLVPRSTDNGVSSKLENIKRIFNDNPDLAFYVRTLYYEMQVADHKSQPFHTVLQAFSRVKALTILGITAGFRLETTWGRMAASLRTGLTSVLTSPSLEEFHLQYIEAFPIKTLAICTNLSHFTVAMSQFDKNESFSQDEVPTSALRLRSLTFGPFSSSDVQTLMDAKGPHGPIVDFSHLTALKCLEKSEKAVVSALLAKSRRLESMSTSTLWQFCRPLSEVLVLPQAHNLKTLKCYRTTIDVTRWFGLADLSLLFSLPDEFVGGNLLERVEIKINFDENTPPPLPLSNDQMAKFNGFAIEDHFPALRLVSLAITLPRNQGWAQGFMSALQKKQGQVFESLMQSDRITFEFAMDISNK